MRKTIRTNDVTSMTAAQLDAAGLFPGNRLVVRLEKARRQDRRMTSPLPVCRSCGKSTRTHTRPDYCAECAASLDRFRERFSTPTAEEIPA